MQDKIIGDCQKELEEVNRLIKNCSDQNIKKAIYLITNTIQRIMINSITDDDDE